MTRKLSVLTSVERRFKGPGTGARGGIMSLGFIFPSISYVDMHTANFGKAASSIIIFKVWFSPFS